jgi:hypothetical protein
MKILHALVGYLTVTAQPFSPFAFSHPLAAGIDGFVNTRQNQNDGGLMKGVAGDIMTIEAREPATVDVLLILFVVGMISVSIIDDSNLKDGPVRGNEESSLDHFD